MSEFEQEYKQLDDAIDRLGEHFDSVQVFVTRNMGEKDGQTISLARGNGNWFARYGQVVTWLNKVDATEANDAIQSEEDE